ncbi:MAG: hypothetical protein CVV37_02495 [Nitrospira bacterium HGW-Nitrospira-1]|nr:MAG: hypothetical protein CVV37_02495 [Nitrospira bacterium HGW-Nitrospira-1]
MKKLIIVMMSLAMVIGISGIAMANGKGLGISAAGSPHNFVDEITNGAAPVVGSEDWNNRKEICRVCHVPHDHGRAYKRWTNGLLWNHAVDDTTTFVMYDHAWSNTLTGIQSAQPDGTAKLCLACHDGVIAVDSFDKKSGPGNGTGTKTIDGTNWSLGYKVPGYIDGDSSNLRGTHPLSIAFPAGEDGDGKNFNLTTTATWANGETVASTLDNGKVQCSTCHDVHDAPGAAMPGTHLLRQYNATAAMGNADSGASKLCLTCHIR